jgi:hypothetical protein
VISGAKPGAKSGAEGKAEIVPDGVDADPVFAHQQIDLGVARAEARLEKTVPGCERRREQRQQD